MNQAELILSKLRDELESNKSQSSFAITSLSLEFSKTLPFKVEHRSQIINSKRLLNQRFEICQVLRDLINVSEETNWNLRSSINSIYRSIGAHLTHLDSNSNEYLSLKNSLYNSIQSSADQIEIINIYKVNRPNETLNFNRANLNNVLSLYHGTKANNCVGILSRGLILPRYLSNEEIVRTDIGLLGFGIYFTDDFATSLKYTNRSSVRNTRFVTVCDVALGNYLDVLEHRLDLTKAPDGYHSVHGVKAENSQFQDNQFVVYDTTQFKLKYLIEFQCQPEDGIVKSVEKDSNIVIEEKEDIEMIEEVDLKKTLNTFIEECDNSIQSVTQKSGLLNESGASIPLKSVHIRAKLLDMISKVVIYQEYENNTDVPIEAKYLFPLTDSATVCGFEAFINDKHIISVCKEKKQAHQEYKEAIQQQKGAYLMDQESNDLFKVSVGNLPPKSKCIIKITYITELEIQNEEIYFKLPNSIASWKLLDSNDIRTDLLTSKMNTLEIRKRKLKTQSSFKASILMPFEIRSIKSPTHALKLKRTQCQAVCETNDILKGDSLIIAIQIATIHMPRMLVEDYFDPELNRTTRACMVSFYPEFEFEQVKNPLIYILIDCSNSMVENNLVEMAKKLGIMALKNLPDSCYFNVIIFGTDYVELFPFALAKNEANMELAFEFLLKNMQKTRGNTDLLNVLRPFYQLDDENLYNFILISDGHFTRSNELLQTLKSSKNMANPKRIFACSVGNVANNNHLLKMVARLSDASYECFDKQCLSKWKEKLLDIMDRTLQPTAVNGIKIEWQNMVQEDLESFQNIQAPKQLDALFNGRRLVSYAFVENCQEAKLIANINGYEMSTILYCPELCITQGDLIHKLAAKAFIDDWHLGIQVENDQIENERIKSDLVQKIINLSKKYNVASEHTSFIAVEERNKNETEGKKQVSILELLDMDNDSKTIDCLPYMSYESDSSLISSANEKKESLKDAFENLILNIESQHFDYKDKKPFLSFVKENISELNEKLAQVDSNKFESLINQANHLKQVEDFESSLNLFKVYIDVFKNEFGNNDGNEASISIMNDLVDKYSKFIPRKRTLHIKSLTGKSIFVDTSHLETVADLKDVVQDKEGIPTDQQRLIFAGRQLYDTDFLNDYNLTDESLINLVLKLRGGPVITSNDEKPLIKRSLPFASKTLHEKKDNLSQSINLDIPECGKKEIKVPPPPPPPLRSLEYEHKAIQQQQHQQQQQQMTQLQPQIQLQSARTTLSTSTNLFGMQTHLQPEQQQQMQLNSATTTLTTPASANRFRRQSQFIHKEVAFGGISNSRINDSLTLPSQSPTFSSSSDQAFQVLSERSATKMDQVQSKPMQRLESFRSESMNTHASSLTLPAPLQIQPGSYFGSSSNSSNLISYRECLYDSKKYTKRETCLAENNINDMEFYNNVKIVDESMKKRKGIQFENFNSKISIRRKNVCEFTKESE